VSSPFAPADLGFHPTDPALPPAAQTAWRASIAGRPVLFRLLFTLEEFAGVERMQRETMGMTDYDLFAATGMGVPIETGGHVLGAYLADASGHEELVGALYAFGGYVQGRPRIVSDFMGVLAHQRSWGLGAALKRLQAAIAASNGFAEVVWTVDPLRAANARLNLVKLGGYCDHHERNRYGESFAESHYGGFPTDRLHMTLDLASERVGRRLRGRELPPVAGPAETLAITIPADIDTIVRHDPAQASVWRFRVREEIEAAFADGWILTHFEATHGPDRTPALILERVPRDGAGRPQIDLATAGRPALAEGATR
jgi:predicted GNAT superfamily acetyltransferase